MKKHHIVLIVVSANLIIFFTYLSLWLGSETHDTEEVILFPILVVSYIMPITLIGLFILLSKAFSTNQKMRWLVYIILTSFIGCFHFYFKYKTEINQIVVDTNKKMREGPDSLGEYRANKK